MGVAEDESVPPSIARYLSMSREDLNIKPGLGIIGFLSSELLPYNI